MTAETLNGKTVLDPNGPGSLVEYRVEDGLAILELNNAPANTYSYEMFRAMDEAILRARMISKARSPSAKGGGSGASREPSVLLAPWARSSSRIP